MPESLTLYLLCQYPQRPMSFAPHGWKTVLPLRYFGVPVQIAHVTLFELRERLPQQLGVAKVTLPTLVIANDGHEEMIMDSFHIAQYLESRYGSVDKSIFHGDVGRSFARFIEHWVDRSLAHAIRPCVLHTSYAQFPGDGPLGDLDSKKAFLAKCGQQKMDELTDCNGDDEWTTKQYAAVRRELGTLEVLLEERREEGPFLGGESPIHADFCIYAFYPYSRTNKQLVEETWHHGDLPRVGKWLAAMHGGGLVDETELLPL